MASLYYSSTAVATTLASGISNTNVTLTVGATTGFPTSYPYKLILDRGTSSEEAIKVTGASGTTLTVVRGIDGTSALNHSAGAVVEHGVTGQDFQDARNHLDAVSNVHGVFGDLVGDSDTQTLTNKTLELPIIISGQMVTPTIVSFVDAHHSHLNSAGGAQITKAAVSDFVHTHHDDPNGGLLNFGALAQAGTDFAPATPWTVLSGTNPTLGNGTFNARYFQLGKLVFYWFRLTIGSTTAVGSGNYRFNLPVTPAASHVLAYTGSLRYGSGVNTPNISSGETLIAAGDTVLSCSFPSLTTDGDSDVWGSGSFPSNIWDAGDTIDGFILYEAA